jgi:Tfp pilus assembly protein PilE
MDEKEQEKPRSSKKIPKWGVIAIACAIGALIFVLLLGVFAAIFIPSMMKYQGKTRQLEARVNIKSVALGAKLYYAEHPASASAQGVFTPPSISDMGITLSNGRIYTVQAGESIEPADKNNNADRSAVLLRCDGVEGAGSSYFTSEGFRFLACGNIDDDAVIDVWVVEGSRERSDEEKNLSNDIKR